MKKRVVLIGFHDRVCLSIRALSAALRRRGHEVFLLFVKDERSRVLSQLREGATNYQIRINGTLVGFGEDVNPISAREKELVQEAVRDIEPDVVGVSARTGSVELAREVVRLVRVEVPHARYIGGGYGPSLQPDVFLEFLDVVCIGEAECIIHDLVCAEDATTVRNVCFMQGGSLQFNGMCGPADIDRLAVPDWSGENHYLIEDNQVKGADCLCSRGVYDIFTSRGCPSACTYCMACQWGNIYGRFGAQFPRIRQRSVGSVIDELKWAVRELGARYIRFRDSIFGFDPAWLKAFLAEYDREIALPFHCLVDERYTDEDSVARLAGSGLDRTTVGIQSVSQAVRMSVLNRQTTDEELLVFAQALEACGVKIRYDVIGWNPFESREVLRAGMSFLADFPKALEVFIIQLQLFPGSPIQRICERLKPSGLSLEEYDYWAMLYTLILHSEHTARKAWEIEEQPGCSRGTAEVTEAEGAMQACDGERLTVTGRVGLRKGDVLSNSLIKAAEMPGEGIPWKEKYHAIGRTLQRDVPDGSPIRWADLAVGQCDSLDEPTESLPVE